MLSSDTDSSVSLSKEIPASLPSPTHLGGGGERKRGVRGEVLEIGSGDGGCEPWREDRGWIQYATF